MSKSKPLTQEGKGWLYNVLAQSFWGTGGIVISLIEKTFPGTMLVGIRTAIGSLLLGINILKGKRQVLKNLPLLHLILLGILAGALPDLLLVAAVRHSGPIIAVLLARLEIPLGVLFAHAFLKEKVTLKAYLASILALIGGGLISYKPGQALTIHSSFYLGVIAGVAAGITWALATVYGKYILNRGTDALALTFIRLSIGSITSLIAAGFLVSQPLMALEHLRLNDWLLLIYLGVFVSGIGYLMFYRSLELIDAHIAQILVGISIAIVIVLGLLIGQHVSVLEWLGIAITTFSIYLIKFKSVNID